MSCSTSGTPQIIPCAQYIDTFHQFTGQCWQDATMILLLFSDKLGPIVQKRLNSSSLVSEFTTYINEYCTREFTNDAKEIVDNFKTNIITYISSLQERFCNWIGSNVDSQDTVLRRTESQSCSIYQEYSGINAANLFNYLNNEDVDLEPMLMPHNIRHNKPIQAYGYNTKRLMPLLQVICDFFVVEPLNCHIKYDDTTNDEYRTLIIHYNKSATNPDNTIATNYYFNAFSVFNYPPIKMYNTIHITIKDDNYKYSLCIHVIRLIRDEKTPAYPFLDKEHHAISFIMCDSNTFIYDDNVKYFISVRWDQIFKFHSTYDPANILFAPYVFYICWDTIKDRPIDDTIMSLSSKNVNISIVLNKKPILISYDGIPDAKGLLYIYLYLADASIYIIKTKQVKLIVFLLRIISLTSAPLFRIYGIDGFVYMSLNDVIDHNTNYSDPIILSTSNIPAALGTTGGRKTKSRNRKAKRKTRHYRKN